MSSDFGTGTRVIQPATVGSSTSIAEVSHTGKLPELTNPHHVLVRVLAVALNPTDHKMAHYFPMPQSTMGCDFCGRIVAKYAGPSVNNAIEEGPRLGSRVCGAVWAYNPADRMTGAFAEYLTVDERLLLKVPDSWSDLEAASVGGIGWTTVGLAFWGPDALQLRGKPSSPLPTAEKIPVLVYGGGTTTGKLACQLLKLSGYSPIVVSSAASAHLLMEYGATASVDYASPKCVDDIQKLAAKEPIRFVLDCITDEESAKICFESIYRVGGRYVCLEAFDKSWQTRRTVKVNMVLAYEGWGQTVTLGEGETIYSRHANEAKLQSTIEVVKEMQDLISKSLIKIQPWQEVDGGWSGIIKGLEMLKQGAVRGKKLVVRVCHD